MPFWERTGPGSCSLSCRQLSAPPPLIIGQLVPLQITSHNRQRVTFPRHISDIHTEAFTRDARPAPAPGKMAAPGRPGPENFQLYPAPPCPTPEKEGTAPPRPAPKITPGQELGQSFIHHQKFLGVKNF